MDDTGRLNQITGQAMAADEWAPYESRSLCPDSAGRTPWADGYQRTVDHYQAAARWAFDQAAAQAVRDRITTVTSEGTTVTADPPDWRAAAAAWWAMSQAARQAGAAARVTTIPLPARPGADAPASQAARTWGATP